MFYLYYGRVVHVLVRIVTAYWTPHETASYLILGTTRHGCLAKMCFIQRVSTNRLRTCLLYGRGISRRRTFLTLLYRRKALHLPEEKKSGKALREHVIVRNISVWKRTARVD